MQLYLIIRLTSKKQGITNDSEIRKKQWHFRFENNLLIL